MLRVKAVLGAVGVLEVQDMVAVMVFLVSSMIFSSNHGNRSSFGIVDAVHESVDVTDADVDATTPPSPSSGHPTACFCIAFLVSSSSDVGGGSSRRPALMLDALDDA